MRTRYVKNPDHSARIQAARDYVSKMPDKEYLAMKPFDPTPGHAAYFQEMYALLGLLKAMPIPFGGRLLEVGSGPGWITEILASLGYHIEAIELAHDFIDVAEQRLTRGHHRIFGSAKFQCAGLEDCNLPAESFDAALFFDSLHHIVDEVAGLRKVLAALKPGGCLGISEGAHGYRNQSAQQMMRWARFGTLESAFAPEYLDALLKDVGFIGLALLSGGWNVHDFPGSRHCLPTLR